MDVGLPESSRQGAVKPHSCKYCQSHVLHREVNSQRLINDGTEQRWFANYTYREAISGAADGCLFFQWCFPAADPTKHLRNGKDNGKILVIIVRDSHIAEIKKKKGVWSRLVASTDQGDPIAKSIKARPVNLSPGSGSSFELIRGWLSQCNCSIRSGPLPTRVLAVRAEDSYNGNPKLCIPNSTDGGEYVCLSYCWGKDQSIKLTAANLSAWASDEGIPFQDMPKTIQDAISATRKIGVRFLWVDRLCIIQDDPKDKAHEIALMPKIFRNASFTISASRAKGSEEGFLHERCFANDDRVAFRLPMGVPTELLIQYPLPTNLKSVSSGINGSITISSDFPPGYIDGDFDEPIHSRAWTLQEYILSPRMLDYGTRQTIWRCPCRTLTDGGHMEWKPKVRRKLPGIGSQGRIQLITPVEFRLFEGYAGLWCEFIEDYTARSMTFSVDRAHAIAGLAEEFQGSMQSSYLAGLWHSMFPAALLWHSKHATTRHPRPKEYRAPSWSWIAVDGPVQFSATMEACWSTVMQRVETNAECVKVLRWEIELEATQAPYGAIRGGYIALEGRLTKASWTDNCTCLKRKSPASYLQGDDDEAAISARTIADTRDGAAPRTLAVDVWLLPIIRQNVGDGFYILGLILNSLSNNSFERLGLFEHSPFDGEPSDILLTSPKREVVIV